MISNGLFEKLKPNNHLIIKKRQNLNNKSLKIISKTHKVKL